MALSYTLPDHLTNEDVTAHGIPLNEYLMIMMLTKVGSLTPQNKDKFLQRVSEFAAANDVFPSAEEWYAAIARHTDYLEGMTTNIQTESYARWKGTLMMMIQERAKRIAGTTV